METKKCSKCSKIKEVNLFFKNKNTKDGFASQCKKCMKKYREKNKEKINKYNKNLYYRDIKKITKRHIKYYYNNRKKLNDAGKMYYNNIKYNYAIYQTYHNKLTIDESPRLFIDGIFLEVKCKYCNKYFLPLNQVVKSRISALNNEKSGDNYLYCSDHCKSACPVYKQVKYPKGFKKATSREVNPLVRQMCFERDNWTCKTCGTTQEDASLHCHHIEGYAQNPRLGNDVANTITLCKECHKRVHKLPGCNYYELKCNKD
jgi:hypothetical protein